MSHRTRAPRAAAAATLLVALAYTGAHVGAPAAHADPDQTLLGALSKGYSSSNCTPKELAGVPAALECGQNADANGPVKAMYMLYKDAGDLEAGFNVSIKDESLTQCGDSGLSPTTWHLGSDTIAGQVACGTYQGGAEIIWTTNAKNVLSYIRGSNSDVPALFQWWKTNG